LYQIYCLKSPSDKVYIGQTKRDVMQRFYEHKNGWKNWVNKGRPRSSYQTKLYYAFDTYDPSLWNLSIIQECDTLEETNQMEIDYIESLDSIENGYNLHKGGWGSNIDEFSSEHKNNISEGRKAWFKTEEGIKHKQRLKEQAKTTIWNRPTEAWNKGMDMKELYPESYKENGSNSKTPEFKEFMKNQTKRNWEAGLYDNRPPLSLEAREKIRQGNLGKKQTDNQKKIVAEKLAQTFIITDPNGKEFEIFNLNKWCRENNMDQGNMSKALNGNIKACKGYKIKRP
jgi:hypothetical protein